MSGARRSGDRGALAIVLHTHLPYVEGFGTWPFGEEWLWEAIVGSYMPLLELLDAGAPLSLSLTLVLPVATTSAWAASSEADFKAAYAAAEAVNKEAAGLRNQWTTTAAALAAAKKAADAGNFDAAVASSKEAEALARASIFQATSEKTRWKDLEIR